MIFFNNESLFTVQVFYPPLPQGSYTIYKLQCIFLRVLHYAVKWKEGDEFFFFLH